MYLAHLEKLIRTRLEDVLVEEGVVDRPRVEDAQAEQEKSGRQLGDILIEREIVSDYDLAKLVVTHYGLPYLDVANYSARREVVEILPIDYCERHAILPLDQFGSTLTLAVTEMPPQDVIDHIVERTKLTPFLFVAVRRVLMEALDAEKKRGPSKPAKPKTVVMTLPPQAAAKPSAARPGTSPGSESPPADPGSALPDLNLPVVSMKLMGGAAAAAAKAPPAPARPQTPAAPIAAKAPADSVAASGLGWMDTVGGGGSSQSSGSPKAPKISKFPFVTASSANKPGGGVPVAPARPKTAAGQARAPVAASRPAAAPAAAAPARPAAASPAAAARPQGGQQGGNGWQSIFDVGEEEVRKNHSK